MTPYARFGPLDPLASLNSYNHPNASNLTGGCPDGVQWIWHMMGTCAVSEREQASAYVGLISMVTWMLVAIPQMIQNFINIDGMGGVSFFLLFQWTAGDTTNLIGAILTNQLKPQIYLACFFVVSDTILLAQFLTFFLRRRKRLRIQQANGILNPSQLVLCLMGLVVFSQFFIEQLFPSSLGTITLGSSITSSRGSRSLLSTQDSGTSNTLHFSSERVGTVGRGLGSSPSFWHNPKDIVGYVIGVISSIFYLGSRTSQIIKNYRTSSTEGLAVLTFILAIFGNLAYGGQILIQSLDGNFILEHTPWIVGSLGVIGLDCALLVQFHYYKKENTNKEQQRQSLLAAEIVINSDEPSVQ